MRESDRLGHAPGFSSGMKPAMQPATPTSSGSYAGPEGAAAFHRSPYLVPAIGGALVLSLIAVAAWWLHYLPGRGASASFSLLIGAVLGLIMQRGRFCFFCIFRDLIQERDSRPFYSILTALAVGSLCYVVIFTAFLPSAGTGRLPPDAHIGPVSWALIVAGMAFGIGMALSGACVSGHLYRLGEGYLRAPFALIGTVIGFGAGFFSWRTLYVSTISTAPQPWLPHYFGYSGAVIVQLGLIGLIALYLMRYLAPTGQGMPAQEQAAATQEAQAEARTKARAILPGPTGSAGLLTLGDVWRKVFVQRWSPGATGAAIGVLGALAYFRVAPLGVTSQLGSIARTVLSDAGLLTGRLNGLDTLRGCVTAVVHTISDNGLLITGLAAASFAAAIAGRNFEFSKLTVINALTALIGGVFMGWGAMIALGCTVGTLLSGIMAFSVSGWVFFASVFAGVWLSLKLRLNTIGQPKA